MASRDEDSSRQRAQDDIANPFIAFRRFADEQMSNLMNGIFGLSTPFGAPSSSSDRKSQDYQAWLKEARASRQSLEREEQEAGRILDVYTKACRDSAQQELQKAFSDQDEPLSCPYRPADQEVSRQYENDSELSLASLRFHLPPTILATPVLGRQLSSVPIGYLLFSPYSPIQLEHHQALRNEGIHWREAFEDLLAVQNGEELSFACEHDELMSGAEWVRQMIAWNMRNNDLNNQIHRTSEALRRNPQILARFAAEQRSEDDVTEQEEYQVHEDDVDDDDDDDDEQLTELDLYTDCLGRNNASANEDYSKSHSQSLVRSFAHLQQDTTPINEPGSKPSILSTLTTTERTTLGDGTVHTKVVLKKRFSDGREESTETEHTQNPVPKPRYQPPTKYDKSQDGSQDSSEIVGSAKKSSGWFWS